MNEEMRRRAGIERELASRADQRVSRWFGMSTVWPELGVDGGRKRRSDTR